MNLIKKEREKRRYLNWEFIYINWRLMQDSFTGTCQK